MSKFPVLSAVLLSVGLTLAGCAAGPTEPEASPSIEASQEVAANSSTPAPSPSAELSDVAQESIDLLRKDGIELGDVIKVEGGSYPQYKVLPSSRLATFEPSTHIGGMPKHWNKKDKGKAQHFAANMLMNVSLDNPTMTRYEDNKGQFIDQLRGVFSPEYMDAVVKSVNERKKPVFMNDTFSGAYTGDLSRGLHHVTDGVTPRIAGMAEMDAVSTEGWDDGFSVVFSGEYGGNLVDKSGDPYFMKFRTTVTLVIGKSDDKFLLEGVHTGESVWTEPVAIVK